MRVFIALEDSIQVCTSTSLPMTAAKAKQKQWPSALALDSVIPTRRFHRLGQLGAGLLHVAIPAALSAPFWWPSEASIPPGQALRPSQEQLQEASLKSLEDDESALAQRLATARGQLRMVFAPPLVSAQSIAAAPMTEQAKPPLMDEPAAQAEASAPVSEAIAVATDANALLSDGRAEAEEPSQLAPSIGPVATDTSVSRPDDSQALNTVADDLSKRSQARAEAPAPAPPLKSPDKAVRKAQLEAELKSLSERIQAYQRQQEKDMADQAAAANLPSEGNWPSSQTQPAPAPESASREAMIQARLPVKLKAFRGAWQYKMYYGDRVDDSVVALVRFEVEVDQELYVLRSQARPQGFAAALFQGEFTQESRGRVSPWGFRPEFYEEQRGQRGKRWAQMDWEQREVRLSDGTRVPIAQGVQDRLSIAWQLSALASSQLARLQSPSGIQIPLILSRHVELNRFFARAVTEEIVDGQRLRLLKVEREPRQGKKDASIEVWLDVDRDMLPVRLRIEDRRGRVVEQVLQKDSM